MGSVFCFVFCFFVEWILFLSSHQALEFVLQIYILCASFLMCVALYFPPLMN